MIQSCAVGVAIIAFSYTVTSGHFITTPDSTEQDGNQVTHFALRDHGAGQIRC